MCSVSVAPLARRGGSSREPLRIRSRPWGLAARREGSRGLSSPSFAPSEGSREMRASVASAASGDFEPSISYAILCRFASSSHSGRSDGRDDDQQHTHVKARFLHISFTFVRLSAPSSENQISDVTATVGPRSLRGFLSALFGLCDAQWDEASSSSRWWPRPRPSTSPSLGRRSASLVLLGRRVPRPWSRCTRRP